MTKINEMILSDKPLLIADLGGTFAQVALYNPKTEAITEIENLSSRNYASPLALLTSYLNTINMDTYQLGGAIVAIAATLTEDKVVLSNIEWRFSQNNLEQSLGVPLVMLNDFEALAFSLDRLTPKMLAPLSPHSVTYISSEYFMESPKLVIGPGTGFGSALLSGPKGMRSAYAAEGGYIRYAPHDATARELCTIARRLTPEKSEFIVEDWLSGSRGIPLLIETMSILHNRRSGFTDAKGLTRALAEDDPFAHMILNRYLAMVGAVAGDLFIATGAEVLYLGGGLLPRLYKWSIARHFQTNFSNTPRLSHYLSEIPCAIIIEPDATLMGVAHYIDLQGT